MQKRNLILLLFVFLCAGLHAQAPAPVGGNTLWMTKSGEQYLTRLLQDIDQARSTIEVEYYWFDTDSAGRFVRDALIRKAQEGVQVRVLMDNLITPLAPEAFYRKMRKAGVKVTYVHDFEKLCPGQSVASVFGYRDHRKIVVIDGRIAYTGGINLTTRPFTYGRTRRCALKAPPQRSRGRCSRKAGRCSPAKRPLQPCRPGQWARLSCRLWVP